MIIGSLALKLEDFEEDYCCPYIVDSSEQNLPDNIIQFPTSKTDYDDNGNLIEESSGVDTSFYSWNWDDKLEIVDKASF